MNDEREKRNGEEPTSFSGVWQERLAQVRAMPVPVGAERLPADVQLLAKVCVVLSLEADGKAFQLGTARAGELIGSDSYAGAEALRVLKDAGLIRLTRRGTPKRGVSLWKWIGGMEAPLLPGWLSEAARGDVRAMNAVLSN